MNRRHFFACAAALAASPACLVTAAPAPAVPALLLRRVNIARLVPVGPGHMELKLINNVGFRELRKQDLFRIVSDEHDVVDGLTFRAMTDATLNKFPATQGIWGVEVEEYQPIELA